MPSKNIADKPIKIRSKFDTNKFIYVKTEQNGESKMWFREDYDDTITNLDSQPYQTMYNKYDLDIFYLTYFYPLLTCVNFVNIDNIKKCLCIGLGGGHIPLFLQKKYPNLIIDVVEIDESVFEASKYMGFRESNNIKVHIENGIDYIKKSLNSNGKYDIIIIDLDGGESFKGFNFEKVSNILEKTGILAINFFSESKKNYIKNDLKHVFNCIKHYDLERNDIYLCKKNLDKFQQMIDKITNSTLSPIFDKYRDNFIITVNSYKSSMVLS